MKKESFDTDNRDYRLKFKGYGSKADIGALILIMMDPGDSYLSTIKQFLQELVSYRFIKKEVAKNGKIEDLAERIYDILHDWWI